MKITYRPVFTGALDNTGETPIKAMLIISDVDLDTPLGEVLKHTNEGINLAYDPESKQFFIVIDNKF